MSGKHTQFAMSQDELPDCAYHPSEPAFTPPNNVTDKESPKTVSSIEQLIRVAIALGGPENALEMTEKAISFQKQFEEENVFDTNFVFDRSRIENSNDVWLQKKLELIAEQIDGVLENELKIYQNRVNWYEDDILTRLEDKIERATTMIHQNRSLEFKAMTVYQDESVQNHNTVQSENYVHIDSLDGMDIREFGYDPPINLVIAVSDGSSRGGPTTTSMYPFLPWCGTTVCAGPNKHRNPYVTLCKHEVAALMMYNNNNFNPNGVELPQRFKRLAAPQAYTRFQNNIID